MSSEGTLSQQKDMIDDLKKEGILSLEDRNYIWGLLINGGVSSMVVFDDELVLTMKNYTFKLN